MVSMVKWFNNEKGFGYIEYKENGDIIVYCSTAPEGNGEAIQLEIADYKAITIKTRKEVK